MTNFGETLTYWYLRLNGFFPLTNFVLHRTNTIRHSADADLLAVRFKHVYEKVGGQPTDWDDWFSRNDLKFSNYITGIIVEVKTGRPSPVSIKRSFSSLRMKSAISRFGFYREKTTVQDVVKRLENHASIVTKRHQIAKLLVTTELLNLESFPPCLHITLPEIEQFITQRMDNYATQKSGDRFFFPDGLIQYFAWKSRN